jgi:hypothetical protein
MFNGGKYPNLNRGKKKDEDFRDVKCTDKDLVYRFSFPFFLSAISYYFKLYFSTLGFIFSGLGPEGGWGGRLWWIPDPHESALYGKLSWIRIPQ